MNGYYSKPIRYAPSVCMWTFIPHLFVIYGFEVNHYHCIIAIALWAIKKVRYLYSSIGLLANIKEAMLKF